MHYETVTLDDLLASTVNASLRLASLDACRNTPLAPTMQRTLAPCGDSPLHTRRDQWCRRLSPSQGDLVWLLANRNTKTTQMDEAGTHLDEQKGAVRCQLASGFSRAVSNYAETMMPSRADSLTQKQRSQQMGLVKSRNTKPELRVRRALWRLGYRYRVNVVDVFGKPDIAFKQRRKAIFVHGCFWHRHPGCPRTRVPKTRVDFWQEKFRRTVERDHHVQEQLAQHGWRVLVIWECESEVTGRLEDVLRRFFEHTA